MVTEQPENAVAGLYALRGGLSALSLIYDDIRKKDGEYYEKLHKAADKAGGARYEAPQGVVNYANWIMGDGFENELNRRRANTASKFIDDNKTNKVYKPPRDYRKSIILMAVGLAFSVLFSILTVLEISNFHAMQDKFYPVVGMFCGLFAGIIVFITICLDFFAIFFFIYWLVCVIKDKRSYNAEEKASKNRHEKTSKENAKNNEEVSRELRIIDLNISKLPQVRAEAQKILNERNETVRSFVKYCAAYYQSLFDEFNASLNEHDWQNLDLIIFKLETRRADSVKEALQLIDREGISHAAIYEANNTVRQSISRGLSDICEEIMACYARICKRAAAIAVPPEVTKGLSGADNSCLSLTIDAKRMDEALSLKAGETSPQLYGDAQGLRNYK